MSLVFLVGFMASGKTSVGAELAERLGRPFFDLDREIEKKSDQPTDEIFRVDGEAAFRAVELNELERLCELDDGVIATGGGAAYQKGAMDLMRSKGMVIHLQTDFKTCQSRISKEGGRPLSQLRDEELKSLYDLRLPAYQLAHADIQTSDKTVGDIASELKECIQRTEALVTEFSNETEIVQLGSSSYPVICKKGALQELGPLVRRALPSVVRVGLISDSRVYALYGKDAEESLSRAGIQVVSEVVPQGESEKNLDRFGNLCDSMIAAGLDRESAIVSLGGGVVGDLAGFVAASLYRGIALVHVPTSLLAMVDASIGGKTAINTQQGKNLVGAFWQPSLVVTDPNTLRTLPAAEFRAALGEVLKVGLLDSASLFDEIEDLVLTMNESADLALPQHLIRKCISFKSGIVSCDEREGDTRKILNLGHTVGHAIERAAGYGKIRHGEAVALGLIAACLVSESMGLINKSLRTRLERILKQIDMSFDVGHWLTPHVLASLNFDKKRNNESIQFIALRGVGQPVKLELSLTKLKTILRSSD